MCSYIILLAILVLSILLAYAYMKYKKNNKVSKNIEKYVMMNKIAAHSSSYTVDKLCDLPYDAVKEIYDEIISFVNSIKMVENLPDEQQFIIYNILLNKFEDDDNNDDDDTICVEGLSKKGKDWNYGIVKVIDTDNTEWYQLSEVYKKNLLSKVSICGTSYIELYDLYQELLTIINSKENICVKNNIHIEVPIFPNMTKKEFRVVVYEDATISDENGTYDFFRIDLVEYDDNNNIKAIYQYNNFISHTFGGFELLFSMIADAFNKPIIIANNYKNLITHDTNI